LLGTSSCVTYEPLVSFEEGVPTPATEDILNDMELRIQPEDLLKIDVYSTEPKAVAAFNLQQAGQQQMNMNQMGMQGAGTNSLEFFLGFFVNEDGTVDLPYLGATQLGGLTLAEAKNKIGDQLKRYVTDAVVNIRFLNFKVTVLGEVNRPGVLRLSNKRVTLLEAMGLAGDLTPYANREAVLIIREERGVRTYERLNLKDYDIFESPYFYLQQNDVVYVEPLKSRIATVADPVQRFISYGSGVLSIVTLIIALSNNG
jgi:polysaccharide biosynthesis/export protein